MPAFRLSLEICAHKDVIFTPAYETFCAELLMFSAGDSVMGYNVFSFYSVSKSAFIELIMNIMRKI